MSLYRKRPIVIEAVQYWSNQYIPLGVFFRSGIPFVGTLEGDMRVNDGDWIIRGVEGEIYPCKDSIFRATYEKVTHELEVDECPVFKHANGFSTERNMIVAVMRELNLDDTDFRLRDKLICAASYWLNAERAGRAKRVPKTQYAFNQSRSDGIVQLEQEAL